MTPRGTYRNALILIPLSVAIGIVAIALGNWFVFAFMVLSVAFQTVGVVMTRRRLGRHD